MIDAISSLLFDIPNWEILHYGNPVKLSFYLLHMKSGIAPLSMHQCASEIA